uniref:Uncharacterized protein n=1 Tax=Panagrolaimus sp. ES5 TaxID=591445 RepID=A0AC34F2V5_9BILA
MENGIAAGSATLSPIDPNGGSVKEEWDSVDQSGELDWYKEEIVFNNDAYKLVATLTPVNNAQTKPFEPLAANKMAVANILNSGILYKVVVFNSNGKYITEKDYKVGQESTAGSITGLNGDGEYTFVVYSIGSTTSNSQITFANPSNPIL